MNNTLIYQLRFAIPIWLITLVTAIFPDNRISILLRGKLISLFLPGRPKGLTIGRDVTLLGANKLFIGKDVYIAKGCWINALGRVDISSEVMLAPYVVIASTKHNFFDGSVYKGKSSFKPVKIGHGSWLAAHSTVIAGISVAPGTLVAANSVVTKKFEPNSVISGVPAKKVKGLDK
jgi:acetyltransferase-like isoleucine patch superfamily enzyme